LHTGSRNSATARTVWPLELHAPFQRVLASVSVIFRVRPDPKPLYAAWNFVTQRSVMVADAHRPHFAEALEMERGVPRIGFE
jgi:hypothetical protein